MASSDLITLDAIAQLVNALGVVGVLIFMVVAFYKGDILAKSVLDKILGVYETHAKELTEEVAKKLDTIVEAGEARDRAEHEQIIETRAARERMTSLSSAITSRLEELADKIAAIGT